MFQNCLLEVLNSKKSSICIYKNVKKTTLNGKCICSSLNICLFQFLGRGRKGGESGQEEERGGKEWSE